MNKRAFVLLSGGLDSTTCLAMALEVNGPSNTEAISIDYGQRHIKETEQAAQICEWYGINHTILDLKNIMSGKEVMLTDPSVQVPDISYDEIKGVSPTYVPFRNGTMLSAITAHAQKYVMTEINLHVMEAEKSQTQAKMESTQFWKDYNKERALQESRDLCTVWFGAHAEDAQNWAYPDCTPEFIGAMANATYIGSYMSIRLVTPFIFSDKAHIVLRGTELGVPYELTWSCYKGEELHCGTCPTCQSRRKAFSEANQIDPTNYRAIEVTSSTDEDPF